MPIAPSDLVTQWSTQFETLFLTEYNQNITIEMAILNQILAQEDLPDFQGNTLQMDWLGAAPQMRQWVDEKRAQGLNKQKWAVSVANYEASVDVDLNGFKDARNNPYGRRIQEMAQNAARMPYNLISDLIKNGAATKCYDGKNFFATNHSEGSSGSQSNLLTGSGGDTIDHITTDFYAAKNALRTMRDDKGEVMTSQDFRPLIWLPANPALEQLFAQLKAATLIANTSNVLAGSFDYVVDPRLTDANDWHMFRTDGVMKPFIWVNRETPHYTDNFDSKSDDVFKRRKGMASVEGRFAASYMMWQKALKVANA